jgi:hypothetical protein
MKLKYSFIIVFLFLFNYSFSCDCPPLDKKSVIEKGLKYSDIVFYGEVLKFNAITGNYTFKIIELFKGKNNVGIVKGKNPNSCSIYPTKKEFWIVYANYNKDNTISMSLCSPSTGFESYKGSYPPPPIKEEYFNIKNEYIRSLYAK